MLGFPLLLVPTMPILPLNVPVRVFVTVRAVNVVVSVTTKVLLVSVLSAPIIVMMLVFVSLRVNWQLKHLELTLLLGMLRCMLVASVILAVVDLTVLL